MLSPVKNLRVKCGRNLLRFLRISSCKLCSTSCRNPNSTPNSIKLLAEFTECSESEIQNVILKLPKAYNLAEPEMISRIHTIKEIQLYNHKHVDVVKLLRFFPVTIKNRVMVLQEAGFYDDKITLKSLLRYLLLTKVPIKMLKEEGYIKKDVNVMERMLSFVNLDKKHYPQEMDECYSNIVTIKKAVIYHYLKYSLGMPEEKLGEKKVHIKRLKHKSLRVLMENIRLSEQTIGLSKTRICKNPFVLYKNPENTYKMLNEIKEIGGVNISVFLHSNPKILCSRAENLAQIKQHLLDYGIPFATTAVDRDIFTFSADTVKERLEILKNDEFLSTCMKHPRVTRLLIYHNKVKKRLKLLNEMKINNASVHTLTTYQNHFDRYYDFGIDRIIGKDTVTFLSSELSCDSMVLRQTLNRTRFWSHIPILVISRNLKFLQEKFTRDEILKSVYILFYPMHKIRKEMEQIEMRMDLEQYRINGKLRENIILPLILYYLEKETNFTGEGMWETDTEISEGFDLPHYPQLIKKLQNS